MHRPIILLAALLLSTPASAHVDNDVSGGFLSGLIHPLAGPDHLLVILAVGAWGALLGRPFVWALPIAFAGVMTVGGALATAGIPLPFVEVTIAASMVVFGLAISRPWRMPAAATVAVVSACALFHGFAHGAELPAATHPVAYAMGFVIATGLIHIAGILVVSLARMSAGALPLRLAGTGMVVAGAWVTASTLGLM